MQSFFFAAGDTSKTVDVFLPNSSSTTGAGLTGLVFNTASLIAYYRISPTGTATSLSLVTQTVGGAYSSGGFVEIDATHMQGMYRLDIPNAVLASQGTTTVYLSGATNLAVVPIQLNVTVPVGLDQSQALPTNPVANSTGEALFILDNMAGRIGTAQAGASSTITLDAGASSTDGRYVGYGIYLYGGTGGGIRGVGQERTIVAYVGSTKVATLAQAWGTNPDATSKFILYVQPFANTGIWSGTVVATPATAGIPDVNIKNINNVVAPTPGATGGILIAGSNAATTFAGLTTGALACTTITASGAVAFQSTFAVTTSTSLAALSCSTLTASGAVAFQSTFAVTGTSTFTGNMAMSAGLNITQSSANTSALVVTGNGTGHGAIFTSGGGVTGDGLKVVSAATNGNGLTLVHAGSGVDFNATTTPLTLAKTTNITGFNDIAATAIVSSGAITTNAGAVSTVTTTATATNLTNAPTSGDFTATMKSSLGTAVGTAQTGDSFAVVNSGTFGNSAIHTQITNLQTHGDTAWATATGFATPTNITNLQTHGDSAWATATGFSTFNPASTGVFLTAAGMDNVVVESGLNARQAMSIIASASGGVLSGAGTTTITIDGAGVVTQRIVATVDTNGNRSAVTLHPPA
jgi:hypothetical protein